MTQSIVLKRGAENLPRLVAALNGLEKAKAWLVDIREYKPTRSNAQNRYLNGVVYKLIGDAIGYDRDDVSEFLCGAYWGWKDKRVPKKPSCPDGIESVPIRTTTTNEHGERDVLNKQDFTDYIAFTQRFAAGKGVYIPDADEEVRTSW